MNERIEEIREQLIKMEGQEEYLEEQLESYESRLINLREDLENHFKARFIINEVSEQTQKQFTDKIEILATMAIKAVFDRDFTCKLILEKKHNKSECRIVIMEDGEEMDPTDECGGGMIDVMSFILRIILHTYENPQSRKVIILDEPFKHMGNLSIKGAQMIKYLSEEMGIQFIIISHDANIIEALDTVYTIEYIDKESIVVGAN